MRRSRGRQSQRREGRAGPPSPSRRPGTAIATAAAERAPVARDARLQGPPSLPPPRLRVLHDFGVHTGGPAQGSLAGPQRQARRAVHRLRAQRGHLPPRPGVAPPGGEGDDVRGGTLHQRPGGNSEQAQDGGHSLARRFESRRGAAAPARVRVLRRAEQAARRRGGSKEGIVDPGGGQPHRLLDARRGRLRLLPRPGGHPRDGRARGVHGGVHGPRRLVRPVRLQGEPEACIPHVRRRRPRGRGEDADGVRRHDGGADEQGVQDQRRDRAGDEPRQEGPKRERPRGGEGRDQRVEPGGHRSGDDDRGVLRHIQSGDVAPAGGEAPFHPVPDEVPALQRPHPPPRDDPLRAVAQPAPGRRAQVGPPAPRCRGLRRRDGAARPGQGELRPGGGCRPPRARGRGADRVRGRRGRAALGGPEPHTAGGQVRRLRPRRSVVVPTLPRVQPVSAVRVPPPSVAVPAAVQLEPGRGGVLPLHPQQGEHDQLARDDPAHPPVVLVQRPAPAGPPRLPVGPSGHHPTPRHVLPRGGLPRGDVRGVEGAEVSRAGGARGVPGPAGGAPRRRAHHHGEPVPGPAVHHVRPAQVRGQVPDGQAEPEHDAQHGERRGRGGAGFHGRRLAEGVHGASNETRSPVLREIASN
mmetsp:Transcript_4346/g.9355  ORF Transcript_4346/g.9355 Transcript_4346/m.9355 type:complete len:637 (+) Transcript_4346:759-2669(+)